MDFASVADTLVAAYNEKDWDTLEPMIAPDLDFTHFNRNFAFEDRDGLMAIVKQFAAEFVPDRAFQPPERVTSAGNVVIRESYYTGTAQVELPGFAAQGEQINMKLCSVLRFNDDGVLVEWKDYG
ncbi:MAG TPA: nuclear transport factor 2 family protein [Solirubrobacteraceae bacterium]|jgi:predicted ester cyclase|nr:nuclear transport factor 2 family protein [Solirubrobacteraceae bacterium]